MSPKPGPPKPWISGHCNKDNPPEIHAQCHGAFDNRPCRCQHHVVDRLLEQMHELRISADAVLTENLEGISVDDATRISNELRMARSALSAAEEFLAKHVAAVWSGKWTQLRSVEGVGQVQPYRTRNTTWDQDELVEDVITARMKQNGGEIPDPMQVVRWLLSVAHIDYFRAGKVEELDLDVADYRHTTYGTVRLRIKSNDMVGATTREEKK